MQTAAHNLPHARTAALALLLIALFPVSAARAASRDGGGDGSGADLFAHGTGDRIWAARVAPQVDAKPPHDVTTLITRGQGDAERWKTLADIPARAIGITRRGGELVVLLHDGEWKLVSEAGVRSGDRLPGGTPLLAIAGDDDTLWAVGTAVQPATTRAATLPATGPVGVERVAATATAAPATSASTAPAGVTSLFKLERGRWVLVTPVPEPLRGAKGTDLSMTVVAHQPVLAGFTSDGRIAVFEWTGREWSGRSSHSAGDVARFEVLALDGRPALWLVGAQGAGAIRRLDGPSDPIELKVADRVDRGRIVTPAMGRLRLLYVGRDDKLFEQPFGPDGATVGAATAAEIERPVSKNRTGEYVQFAVMVLLLFVMSGTIRRRQQMQDAIRQAGRLPLAPYGRRLLAGTIDAVPLLSWGVVLIVLWTRGTQLKHAHLLDLWLVGATIVYLLHTTTVEIFFGRTVGKMLLGLRPATLEGAKPAPRALLTRNLLRIIDIVLLFPLVMILFSPLRQRVGDLAAGTLVIVDGAGPLPPEDDEETQSALEPVDSKDAGDKE
jgi:uncharacterized RDD family membrane protein YckC